MLTAINAKLEFQFSDSEDEIESIKRGPDLQHIAEMLKAVNIYEEINYPIKYTISRLNPMVPEFVPRSSYSARIQGNSSASASIKKWMYQSSADTDNYNWPKEPCGSKSLDISAKKSEENLRFPIQNLDLSFGFPSAPISDRNLYNNIDSPTQKKETKSITQIEKYSPSENYEKIKLKLAGDNAAVQPPTEEHWLVAKFEEALAKKTKVKKKKVKTQESLKLGTKWE